MHRNADMCLQLFGLCPHECVFGSIAIRIQKCSSNVISSNVTKNMCAQKIEKVAEQFMTFFIILFSIY